MNKISSLIIAGLALSISTASYANGFYGTVMVGASSQTEDSQPYGSNLAIDPDFPSAFDSGDGKFGALGLGYRFNSRLSVEARLGVHKSDFNSVRAATGERAGEVFTLDGDIGSRTLTVEGIYSIPTNSAFSPYLKAGIGVSRNKYSLLLGQSVDGSATQFYDGYADDTSTEFTWNVGFGASYALNKSTELFGEYQYVSFGDVQTGQDAFTDGFEVDAAANEVSIGLRRNF